MPAKRRLWFFAAITLSFVLTAYLVDQRSSARLDIPWRTFIDQWRETCPRPDRPRRSLADTIYTPAQCYTPTLSENATLADPGWTVSVCYKPGRCNAVTVFISARDPSMCQLDRKLSPEEDIHDGLASFGPAEFHAQVVGAEKYIVSTGPTSYDEEMCEYRLDVALQTAGEAELQVWMFHEDWQAVDEFYQTWPPQLRLPIFELPYRLDCPAACPQTFAPLNVLPTDGDLEPSPSPILSSLSTCSWETPGAYLASVPENRQFDLYPTDRPYRPDHLPGLYRFQPQNCLYRHPGIQFADHKSCVDRPSNVLITGDSHGRVLYDAMVWRLDGHRDVCIHSAKAGDKNTTIGETFFKCLWDPRMWDINHTPCEDFADYDALVVSVGSHHAGNAPTAEFLKELRFFERLAECNLRAKLVFATPPPQPPRVDEHVRDHNDHRTISRLTYWGQLAADRARAAGWRVVDLMALLRPFMFDPLATDLAHFLDTDGLEAVMDELLGEMELCGAEEVDAPGPFVELR